MDRESRHACPKCGDAVMHRHFFSVRRAVALDECPKCGGFWLDAGELGRIRNLFESEEDRKRAAAEYFDDVFGERLASMRAESEAHAARASRIAHIFRFICPSYYIPGKQEWGAF
ncbi:MAG: zf-TFIIB domain-containing protein [Gemmatimonadota bacterium]